MRRLRWGDMLLTILTASTNSCCSSLLQIVNSRAFAAGRQKGDGADQEEWRFCAPLLDMLDHGGPCKSPIQDISRETGQCQVSAFGISIAYYDPSRNLSGSKKRL